MNGRRAEGTSSRRAGSLSEPAAEGGAEAGGSGGAWTTELPFCLALSVSFFVKNSYTLLLVLPPVAVFLVATRAYRRLVKIGSLTALLLGALLWLWGRELLAHGGTEYLRVVFFDNTLGRFTRMGPPPGAHLGALDDAFVVHESESALMPIPAVASDMLPWILVLPAALWAFYRRRSREPWRLFLKLAFASIVLLLTLSASRVETYFRPVIFVLSLMAGDFLQDVLAPGAQGGWGERLLAWNSWLVGVLAMLAPVGAAVSLGIPALAGLSIPCAFAFAWAARRSAGGWHRPATARAWGTLSALALAAGLAVVLPALDRVRSWRPFFDEVRANLDGHRQLWTTIVDDKKLPAMTWYLDRRVELLDDRECVPELLSGPPRSASSLLSASTRPCARSSPPCPTRPCARTAARTSSSTSPTPESGRATPPQPIR